MISAQAAQVVGTTSAKFGVTPGGSASYSIPVAMPKGTADMQPKLALQYNSRDRNSIMGVGWKITGLSYINRCATNLYMDDPEKGGVGIDPVDYDDNDKFCLNGERLMAVKGAYGADGTEYRTFFEEFSKVISHGTSATGPTSFTVYKKTGEILTYGGTADSRFQRNTQDHVRTWALSKLADAKGNYISYSYHNDRPNGEFYINRIDYTGNDTQGLSPYNHVSFLYEDRTDKITHYKAGDKITLTKRLNKIQVFTESQLAHEYRVVYGAGDTGRSRITSITECADAETCFKPTVFEWNEGKVGPEEVTVLRPNITDYNSYRYNFYSKIDAGSTKTSPLLLDYDGDGNKDVIIWHQTYKICSVEGVNFLRNKGKGVFEKVTTSFGAPNLNGENVCWTDPRIGDFNGDGRDDILVNRVKSDSIMERGVIYFSNGDGNFTEVSISGDIPDLSDGGAPLRYSARSTGDFNGDGRTDFFHFQYYPEPVGTFFYSDGNGAFTKKTITNLSLAHQYYVSAIGDFNGDGQTDVYLYPTKEGKKISANAEGQNIKYYDEADTILLSNKNNTHSVIKIEVDSDLPLYHKTFGTGDFNGDGLADIISKAGRNPYKSDIAEYGGLELNIRLSNGDGTFRSTAGILANTEYGQKIHYQSKNAVYRHLVLPDINGDGYSDLIVTVAMVHPEYDGKIGGLLERYLHLSKGDGSFSDGLELKNPIFDISIKTGLGSLFGEILGISDFNGDGLSDLITRDFYEDGRTDVTRKYGVPQSHLSTFLPPEKITSITNGHGLNTKVSYNALTDNTIYTKGTTAQYPVLDSANTRYVVTKVDADNGTGSQNSQTYLYEGLQYHLRGLRNLGFRRMLMTDVPTGIKTETIYNQDWQNHHQGLLKTSKTIAPDNTVMNERTLDWKVRGFKDENGNFSSCFRYADQTTLTKRDLNGTFILRETEKTTFDDLGFRTRIEMITENEDGSQQFSKVAQNTFVHNTDTWRLGQLSQSIVESKTGQTETQTTTQQQTIPVAQTSTTEENFEGTVSGWNNNSTENTGTTYTNILGRHGGSGSSATQQIYKTFSIPETTTEVKIEFDFFELGIWYNQQFKVFVNDQQAAVGTFISDGHSGDDSSSNSSSVNSGTIGSDAVEKHKFTITIPVDAGQTSIKIGFGAADLNFLPAYGLVGYWGIDNLTITSIHTIDQTVDVETTVSNFVADPALTVTNTQTFTYDTDGYLLSTTAEPDDALTYTKTNTLNAYGVIEAVTETWGSTDTDGIAATSRTTSFEFDDKVRFVTKETNPLGHTESNTYHPILGIVTSTTGPNGLTTTYEHDVFGRKTKETKADGTTTDSAMQFCSTEVPCPTGAVYHLRSVKSDGSEKLVYMNKLNLEIKSSALLDSKWVNIVTEYDAIGREKRKTQPHFDGGTQHWTANTYDILDRKTRVDRPDGSFQTATFNGLIQVSTNELGQTKTVTKNVIQKDAAITNHKGRTITYAYDGAGQLLTMTANGEVTSYAYDIRGNKISDSDPDKGTWIYRYNALGKIVEQTNAKGETTTMTYDVLGRMLNRIDDANATNPSERTSSWEYDTATNGIGKIHKIISPNYTIINSYDTLGRPVTTQEAIDGENFTTSTTYDSQSRPDTTSYPSGVVTKNTYDAQGTLLTIANNDASETWWERLEVDARGNVSKAKHGNGVETMRTFDPVTGRLTSIYSYKGSEVIQDLTYSKDYLGNLTRREDKRLNQVETFVYDTLNRVTEINTTVGGSTNTVTMTYGITGNILTKSDVGTYTYGEVHASCGTSFAGPHAVTTVSGTKNATYCYDANGNMTSGDGRTTTYTAFDKPTQITKGGNTVNFYYGPDRKRFKRVDNTVVDGTKTTIYAAGKAYERITDANGVQEKHYVGDFAVITKNTANGGTLRTSYMHRDHLGSVDVLTDETGTVQQRMSFDTWGKRREINWQQMTEAAITTFDTGITTRGFTGHEQVDSVGLVHMNGRVYEPELGRFLSADPIVEAIDNLQTYNRYSYVRNNPVTLTDPSGFQSADDGNDDSDNGVDHGGDTDGADENNSDVKSNNSNDNSRQGSSPNSNSNSNHSGLNDATQEALEARFVANKQVQDHKNNVTENTNKKAGTPRSILDKENKHTIDYRAWRSFLKDHLKTSIDVIDEHMQSDFDMITDLVKDQDQDFLNNELLSLRTKEQKAQKSYEHYAKKAKAAIKDQAKNVGKTAVDAVADTWAAAAEIVNPFKKPTPVQKAFATAKTLGAAAKGVADVGRAADISSPPGYADAMNGVAEALAQRASIAMQQSVVNDARHGR